MVEQRYQACQASLAFDSRIVRDPGRADEGATMVSAFLNRYLDRFLAHQPEDGSQDVMRITATTVSAVTARLIRDKLQEIADALEQPLPAGETGVPVEVLLGFLSPGLRSHRSGACRAARRKIGSLRPLPVKPGELGKWLQEQDQFIH